MSALSEKMFEKVIDVSARFICMLCAMEENASFFQKLRKKEISYFQNSLF